MAHSSELADCDAATSRSSAKRVAGVVSKFNQTKRKLVIDIGFGGILEMPQVNKTPCKFTVWLLSKLDVSTRSIVVNGVCKVKLTDTAFHRVLGVPCGSRKLVGLDTNEQQDKIDFIKLALGSISLKVTKQYSEVMNKEETDRFKIAFVVFVIGHFLIAKTRTNHGMDEFWGSLLNTDEIHLHNFCSMVIDEIIESTKRVQEELRAKRPVKNVTGCTLGLQILYLDTLKLSGFSLPQETLPRIDLFDLVLLKKMIHADQENNISYCQSETSKTHVKKRVHLEGDGGSANAKSANTEKGLFYKPHQPAVSSYLTAYLRGSIEQKLTYGQVDAMKWHNARMILHVRKTKEKLFDSRSFILNEDEFKSIVEVHMEELMAKIFQDNLSLAKKLHNHSSSVNTTSFRDSKSNRSLNMSSGYYGSRSEAASSVGAHSTNESLDSRRSMAGKSKSTTITPIEGKRLFPDEINTSSKRIKQEADIGTATMITDNSLLCRKSVPFVLNEEAITAIVENGSKLGVDYAKAVQNYTPFKRLKCKQKRMAPDPWKTGARRKVVNMCVTNDLYDWLENNNMSTLHSNWIVHAIPKYIELDGFLLKDIIVKGRNFSSDAFDIAIRRMVQLDCFMYGAGIRLCWRHIMESDFAMLALNGNDPLESVSKIYQFTMRFNEYDISECRMIIIPALVNITWCAYFWDMEKLKVHVIDPLNSAEMTCSVEKLHKDNIEKIQACLSKTITTIFYGWQVNWTQFTINFVKPIISSGHRASDGLLTLLSIQEFDGSTYVESQTEETIEAFSKLVLYEMVSLEENYGNIPSGYIQTIN